MTNKKLLKLESELLALYSEEKQGKIGGLANRFRIPFQEAEDIYQKAFIKAFSKLKNFKGQSSLKTWVFRITQNIFLDQCRKSITKRERNMSSFISDNDGGEFTGLLLIDENSDPSVLCESLDHNSKVNSHTDEALNSLSDSHKKVIELVFKNGLSYEKTAREMRCSVGTVMSRVFYARRQFIKVYNRIQNKTN